MPQARLSAPAHDRLARLAQETGQTQQEVIEVALSRYERELFFQKLNEDFAALRANPEAWKDELDERAEWDATLGDGGLD